MNVLTDLLVTVICGPSTCTTWVKGTITWNCVAPPALGGTLVVVDGICLLCRRAAGARRATLSLGWAAEVVWRAVAQWPLGLSKGHHLSLKCALREGQEFVGSTAEAPLLMIRWQRCAAATGNFCAAADWAPALVGVASAHWDIISRSSHPTSSACRFRNCTVCSCLKLTCQV
jgi:hypothetical protein